MFDGCLVYTNTADADNAIGAPCVVHCVEVEHADGTGAVSVQLHDAPTVTGTALCSATTEQVYASNFTRSKSEVYPSCVNFEKGISANITGTGTYRIYYTLR